MNFDDMGPAEKVAYFMAERERVRILKEELRLPAPWTRDSILSTYRFCNVRREDDRVTSWISAKWRTPYADHPNLTVAMVFARMVNWPPTLAKIGFPVEFDERYIRHALNVLDHPFAGEKVWGGAYIVTTCGVPMSKAVYVVQNVCGAVLGAGVRPKPGDSLEAFWTRLRAIPGLGAGFIAAQVVADLKYAPNNPLELANDWHTWSVPGPGSTRGLNRFLGRNLAGKFTAGGWSFYMGSMAEQVKDALRAYPELDHLKNIHMQDWQNVMCEFDKYMRTHNGEGKPRSKYRPSFAY